MERRLRRDAPALMKELAYVDPNPLGAASTGQETHFRLRTPVSSFAHPEGRAQLV